MTNELLFHSSPLPMWVYDRISLKFLVVNDAAVRIYGYTSAEFLQMEVNELCSGNDDYMSLIQFGERKQQQIHTTKGGEDLVVLIHLSDIDAPFKNAVLVTVSSIGPLPLKQIELGQQERKFMEIVQDGGDMIAVVSVDLRYIYLNKTLLKFLGKDARAEQFIGHSSLQYVDKRDHEKLLNYFENIYSFDRIRLEPLRCKNLAGDIFWVETLLVNLTEDPLVGGYLCSFRDVTLRVKNEAKLRESAERYEIVSKATSDTIWDWNLLNGKIHWNKGIKGIFGYKDLIENTTSSEWWANQIHPEDRERVTNNVKQHIINGIARWQEEYRFCCSDGSYKFVLDRGFMVFDDQGASVRMICSMQDISQRKQEEEWSRLLESVVINATDAVLICTGNVEGSGQSIIYVNEAFTRMSGYHKNELLGASPRISQGPETDRDEIRKLSSAIANKVPCEIEVINYTKQGKEYWVSQSNAPIADETGKVTHWISIQRDITQNKMHLREIEEQNKKFKEIAWIQSHLVRAPLARVMGLVDLLKNFEPGDDKDELLLHLENSAKELDAIIINIADKTPSHDS
ncbi:PAS domain-containing protein [Pedobacter antarcticus]|uniref:PAS domain-containing protein n=1 Tax=Pedobacter antarcticus TaxID=34086 RepID=UPI001C5710DC|nr:PAS domain S-box protein [Pedobacter antarcticus]